MKRHKPNRRLINKAKCPYQSHKRICRNEEGKHPELCPTVDRADLIAESLKEYEKPDVFEFARQASIQEVEGYANRELGYERVRPVKTRIEEIIEFSRKMNYERLGLAFCIGLGKEARAVDKIFSSKGFQVISAVCKVGRVSKEKIGLDNSQKVAAGGFESMCNPVLQALVLNKEKTEFNILLGLCVGHDSLFFQYAQAPCTVLATKDRLLGHNPLAAIYNMDSYYRCLK